MIRTISNRRQKIIGIILFGTLLFGLPKTNFCDNNLTTQKKDPISTDALNAQDIELVPEHELNKEEERDFDQSFSQEDISNVNQKQPVSKARTINDIIISGNKYTSRDAILSYIPYKINEIFNPQKSRQLIRNLYYGLKRFRSISVLVENVGTQQINLHVKVEEKPILKEVILEGNKQVSTKEIKQKINFDIPAIEESELKVLAQQIKRLYTDKGFFQTEIETELQIDDDDRAIAIFTVHERKKSLVKRIIFTGNKNVSSKMLHSVMFTREDWILGFLDKSGSYHPDRIDADKHMIEQFYQNNGYLNAKVTDVEQKIDPDTKNINLTFDIEEGALYTIGEVHAPGNDFLTEAQILAQLSIRPGQIYSREAITNCIKTLEFLWGNYGHIFAHIEPSIQPNDETKTVDVSFFSDLGDQIYLNKINIKGHKKTRDKIVRRKVFLEEGALLTNALMEASKNSVESLGYFDPRDGVNWKIRRIDNKNVDLDLMLKEAKTGTFNVQMGFGGAGVDLRSPAAGFNVKAILSDRNLFGSGINLNFEATWAKNEQTLLFHLGQPWLFDRPISGALDVYHKRPTYDNLRNIDLGAVNEKLTGAAGTAGFIINNREHPFFNNTHVLLNLGVDSIHYENLPKAVIPNTTEATTLQYQSILDKQFVSGNYLWLANIVEQDIRNHPIHSSRGHRWTLTSKIATPSFSDKIGFYKFSFDGNWFTPIIGEYDLVLRLHAYLGFITPIGNRNIPFGELFHIGGPASVRGFLFGQIGPKFAGDSIGATKAMFWNAELIFPITPDFNMKGVVFYDGGAGFDSQFTNCVSRNLLTNNNFDYRHSVGFGVRLLNPMPIKVDWGFKIDPRNGESSHEVHFGMSYDW